MNNIFATPKIASEFKRIGFEEDTLAYRWCPKFYGDTSQMLANTLQFAFSRNHNYMENRVGALTWSQAVDYLRERHKFELVVERHKNFPIYRGVVYHLKKKVKFLVGDSGNYNTHDEALEMGIEFILDNFFLKNESNN